jgi:hypothetical protein
MKTKTSTTLPPDILVSDLKYSKDVDWKLGDGGVLTFYYVDGRRANKWYIATLRIGSGRQYADRTYAIDLNGHVARIGKGPHVKETIRVYIRKQRLNALQKYLDLYQQGLNDASQIRDRISSRRAQGQLERASGNTWWRWNT